MALGGGTFVTQNKVLPGSYINFVSMAKASGDLSDRGYVAMGLILDWGCDGQVFEVTQSGFLENAVKIFGYDYSSSKLAGIRDLFLNAKVLYGYKLNSSGNKASCKYCTAKYSGVRGNDIKIVIETNVDDTSKFDVITYLDDTAYDVQIVANGSELVANDFVEWVEFGVNVPEVAEPSEVEGEELEEQPTNYSGGIVLELTSGISLMGGTNGDVTAASHQDFLNGIESYNFNTLGANSDDQSVKALYATFTKRMRDEVGAKFQTVVHNYNADYEGVINIVNSCDEDITALVYWTTGLQAGCLVNKSCLNNIYNGEFTVNSEFTQSELVGCIERGEFVLHKVGKEFRVLSDINSLVSFTDEKGEVFCENQTMRVCDQIANDIATLFNTKYLGIIPNDESGRISLWADIVKHHKTLESIRAVENFSEDDITVSAGESKRAVVVSNTVTVVNAMAQLYMSVQVS